MSDLGPKWVRLSPNGKIWDFLKSVHSDGNLILTPEFVPFYANLTQFRPKSDTHVLETAVGERRDFRQLITLIDTFFTFQSNVSSDNQ